MEVKSKVVILDNDADSLDSIKAFLNANGLIGLRAQTLEVVKTLNEHVDLGALILSDIPDENGLTGFDIVRRAYKIRRELPIFMRLSETKSAAIPSDIKDKISGTFDNDCLDQLKELVDKYLFCIYFPDELVSGISAITEEVLATNFTNANVNVEHPIVVRDQFVYGELFSLIALESDWCRGYMMLQADEGAITKVIEKGATGLKGGNNDFRDVNEIMSEITNMIWGKLKSRYMSSYTNTSATAKPQVPIMVNHNRGFASFGTVNPQLCFEYSVRKAKGQIEPINFLQKFVFNLDWSPENFKANESVVDECVDSGELELW